jgi:hypothetical protein
LLLEDDLPQFGQIDDGFTDHIWSLEDLVGLAEQQTQAAAA